MGFIVIKIFIESILRSDNAIWISEKMASRVLAALADERVVITSSGRMAADSFAEQYTTKCCEDFKLSCTSWPLSSGQCSLESGS